MHGEGTVIPSNILEKLFLCLDTNKSNEEEYRAEHEQVVKIKS